MPVCRVVEIREFTHSLYSERNKINIFDNFMYIFVQKNPSEVPTQVYYRLITLVPNLGVNYQNWVMGPFDLGNGWVFPLVF